jgi:Cu/Ag efflux pump CusA
VARQVALKVFGPDLRVLRDTAQDVQTRMRLVPGVVDLQVEPQVEVSQVRLVVWYDEYARNDPAVIGSTVLDTPSGRKVALEQIARVLDTMGPNLLNREAAGRDGLGRGAADHQPSRPGHPVRRAVVPLAGAVAECDQSVRGTLAHVWCWVHRTS